MFYKPIVEKIIETIEKTIFLYAEALKNQEQQKHAWFFYPIEVRLEPNKTYLQ